MKMFLALAIACLSAAPSFADTLLVNLPAGSAIRFTSRRSVPAGWKGVFWNEGAIGFTFRERLQNNLDLSGVVETSRVGVFEEIPCYAQSDESSGRIGVCIQRHRYTVPLAGSTLRSFQVDDIRDFECRRDAGGALIKESVGRGEVTIELLNACFADVFEIIPNETSVRP